MPVPPFPDTPSGQAPQKFYVKKFRGLNQQSPRQSIDDSQFAWLENMMPIADGNLRATYDIGTSFFSVPGSQTIVNSYFYNLGLNPLAIVFLSDGTAYQVPALVTAPPGASLPVSTSSGTFFNGQNVPVAAQWNSSGIIIATEATDPNGYYAWDGATLYPPNSSAPNWLTNNTPTTMPNGVHGSAIEVYQNRAWIISPSVAINQQLGPASPPLITNSAPSNGADFTTTDGANTTPQQDASLRANFTVMKQSGGFLYLFGDSNVAVISNVQTGGSPTITTYLNINLSPQTGCAWPGTAQIFGQSVIFANATGVYILNGGTIQKISYELDLLFQKAVFSPTPTGAVAFIFGMMCYMILLQVPDNTLTLRSVLCVWTGRDWFIASQSQTLTAVFSQEFNSQLLAWGTNGTNLWPLFQTPNSALQKTFRSKLFAAGQDGDAFMTYIKPYRMWIDAVDFAGSGIGYLGTIDTYLDNTQPYSQIAIVINSQPQTFNFQSSNGEIFFTPSLGGTIFWGSQSGSEIAGINAAPYGLYAGVNLFVTGADFIVTRFAIEYAQDATYLG